MSVAHNTVLLTGASIAQKVIAFLYFTLVANRLGPEQTGSYFLALSVIVMFSVLSDWGVTSVLIREVAAHQGQATALLRRALGLKIPLILLACAATIGGGWLLQYDAQVMTLLLLGTPILAADALSLLFYGVLRGLQNLRFEAVGIFLGQCITAGLGFTLLVFHPVLSFLLLALLAGSVWNLVYSAIQVARRLGPTCLVPSISLQEGRTLLRLSMAFGLAGVFVKIYSSVDTILLSIFQSKEAVGVYAVAYKLTYAFQFIPLAFVGALYPAMSALVKQNREALVNLFDRSLWYMALIAVPITFGIASTADRLIAFFYPQGYSDAVPALQVLIFVLLFIFLDFPVGSLLNAAHEQNKKTAAMGCAMVVNILLNLWLIPRIGVMGATFAALVSFVLLFVVSFAFVPRVIPYGWQRLFKRTIRILIAGGIMSAAVFVLKPFLPLAPLVLVGALAYAASLLLLGELRHTHWRELRASLRTPRVYATEESALHS